MPRGGCWSFPTTRLCAAQHCDRFAGLGCDASAYTGPITGPGAEELGRLLSGCRAGLVVVDAEVLGDQGPCAGRAAGNELAGA